MKRLPLLLLIFVLPNAAKLWYTTAEGGDLLVTYTIQGAEYTLANALAHPAAVSLDNTEAAPPANDETTTEGTEENTDNQPAGGLASMLPMLMITGLFFVVIYFMMIRPESKRKKQRAAMLNELIVGDTVTTNGGIVGRVISIKDDTVTIETGADKVRLKIMRWAIASKDMQITDS